MVVNDGTDWSGISWDGWTNLSLIRARLAARALAAAGADPWRPMMNGWSPGRLSLATPTPDLFALPVGEAGLSAAETAAVAEARHLITALGRPEEDGFSLACVSGITAAEAARRLEATPADDDDVEDTMDDPFTDFDGSLSLIGITDVPGGCVVFQPWGYNPSTPGVMKRLSVGSVCYGMFANPKSGNQGAVARDGVIEEWDTHPGGGAASDEDPTEDILTTYLYHCQPVAYCYAGAGLQPTDARSITDRLDAWLRLPEHDWWS